MRLSTLILSKSAKSNDKKGYYPCTLSGEYFNKKTGNIMKIRLDFKRGNSHGPVGAHGEAFKRFGTLERPMHAFQRRVSLPLS